jgi:hypothetical protein
LAGTDLKSLSALFCFHVAYAAILMAGWNINLSTYTELLLWRIVSTIQLGTIVSAWFTMPMQIHDIVLPPNLQRIVSFAARKRDQLRGYVNLGGGPMERWYDTHPFALQLKNI